MKITVKTIDAQSVQLDADAELTVKELKKVILEKLDVSVDKQIRLIWRGKVLSDDKKLNEYATDELMLHLVYKAPPPEGATSSNANDTPPTNPPHIAHAHNVVFLQSVPMDMDIHANIAQVTQSLVDQVLSTLNAQGAQGQVTATASSVDSSGRTEHAHVTASTGDEKPPPGASETPQPTPSQQPPAQPTPSQQPPAQPTPSQPPRAQPTSSQPPPAQPTPSQPPPAQPTPSQPPPPQPTPSQPPPAQTVPSQQSPTPSRQPPTRHSPPPDDEDEQEERERRERAQEYRTQKNIRGHVKSAYRCLQHADRVLVRYRKAESRASGAVAMETDEGEISVIPLADVENVLAVNNGTTSVNIYVTLLNYQEQLSIRARPLVQHMIDTINRSQPHNEAEAWRESQIAQTVRDFNYYMGHAAVSLSRLHVNMFAPPPRVIASTAPKTTEMRNIMSQMRSMHAAAAPRPPSGYIIEVAHNDESGQERTTRATLNTGGRPGGLFGGLGGMGGGLGGLGGGMGGGLGGLGGLGGMGGGLGGMGGGLGGMGGGLGGMGGGLGGMGAPMGGGGGLLEMLRQRREERMREEAEKKKAEAADGEKDSKTEPSASGIGPTEMETELSMPSTRQNEGTNGDSKTQNEAHGNEQERMDVNEVLSENEDEPKRKPTADTGPVSVPSKAEPMSEQAASDETAESPAQSSGPSKDSTTKPSAAEGDKTEGEEDEEERELTETEKEIPDYLARLVAHIVAGTSMEPSETKNDDKEGEDEGEASGASGDKKEEEKKDERELTFAQRFAGPVGTKVTIRQPPQPAMFPGMPPMEGPSITIHNPGEGAEPEMTVNFPMPPALQLLRNILTRDSDSDSDKEEGDKKKEDETEGSKKEGKDGESAKDGEQPKKKKKDGEGKEGEGAGEGGEADRPLFRRRKKPSRKAGEEPSRQELWGEDRDEVESISDAGSLDSIDSDHEVSPLDTPVGAMATQSGTERGPGSRESMLNTFTQLRQRYAGLTSNEDDEEDADIGMVERLLQDISKELSVLEVMSVFNGDTAPLGRLQPVLREFVRERLLCGEVPTLDRVREEAAVRSFVRGCLPSLRAVEDQLPLRDTGIDFPMTINCLFSSQFKAAYKIIVREYLPSGGSSQFALALSHWAKTTSALFGQVLRHCINGEQYFEDLVKMLVNTLFPPTTPPLILNMCNSTIHKQLARVRGHPSKSPKELDSYLVWKEGATPTPNRSYDLGQFLANQAEFSADMPTAYLHQVNPEGVEYKATPTDEEGPPPNELPESWGEVAKRDKRTLDTQKASTFHSDAYLSGMPSKKRKLDMSKPQSVPAENLVKKLVTDACTSLTPQGEMSSEDVSRSILESPGLADALRSDIHRGISKRLSENPHFLRERYPNANQYFNVPPREEGKMN